MRDEQGKALYVGKARNLKKRVASYFDNRDKGPRLNLMIRKIHSMEVSLTRTEAEALLLENEWIKSLKPRFNINLRDDKSYPWIRLSSDHDWPRASFYRGSRKAAGEFFGPFASAGAVRSTLDQIYRLFRVRQCRDTVFANRTRPCLQYQIKCCSAPCVGLISAEDYARDVATARAFLKGETSQVVEYLAERMDEAAAELDYEQAAVYRDRIQAIRKISSSQYVTGQSNANQDVIGLARQGKNVGVQVTSFRQGHNVGSKTYFPGNVQSGDSDARVLSAFLGQFYAERIPPPEILVSLAPDEKTLWEEAFRRRREGRVRIVSRVRGDRAGRVEMTVNNAADALRRRLDEHDHVGRGLDALAGLLGLGERPGRIECFDISHVSGTTTVGACVVLGPDGPDKSGYRLFNIDDVTPGDDYAALSRVLDRRYRRVVREGQALPDLIIIDGGKGQVATAHQALAELGLDDLPVMGVAKGPARRAGYENWITERGEMSPGPDHPASHVIQRVRDEAHRFAVSGHRRRRANAARSPLEKIPGVGPRKRQALLNHFGGLKGLQAAGEEEIARVPGIGPTLARTIIGHLRDTG